jgi:Uncharacterized protein conserved in bacteria
MKKEIDILSTAAKKFELSAGITVTIEKRSADRFRDAIVILHWQKRESIFDGEVKAGITMAIAGMFNQNRDKYENTPLLITSYVQPAIARHLRTLNINFIDAAGNAYIRKPPLLIDIRGNKPEEPSNAISRLFRSSGLKIIFALLCNPGLEKTDYRTIAAKANVALGSVGWITRDLRQNGYLINLGKNGRLLVNKEELLKKWVSLYHEQLRPKIMLGHFTPINAQWRDTISKRDGTLWGSEAAAEILTKHLRPERYTLYVKELRSEFLLANKLLSDPSGTIELLKKFWNFNDRWSDQGLVPPLLIYADLIAGRIDRNIETAKIIYDNEITRLIKED